MSNDFKKYVAQTSPFSLSFEIEKADGVYLFDKNGKRYFDLISGIGVNYLGHNHPDIINAIQYQSKKYLHSMVYGEHIQSSQVEYAKAIVNKLPDSIEQVYFTNSGTEANEGAIKLAKKATGKSKIIAFKGAYHGSTHGSLSVSGNPTKKDAFRPLLPEVYQIELNNFENLIEIDDNCACVILETIQGDAGVRVPTKQYLKALRTKCNETGTLLILDEVQCGIGRTGKLFAFEHFDIVPDILTLGKSLGAGLPLGGFVGSKILMETLTVDPPLGHITTYGGNPVCCAAGLAAFNYLINQKITEQVEAKGLLIESLLAKDGVIEIRRIGLLFAIELQDEAAVNKLVENCLHNGVIAYWFLSNPNCFRLAPPLTISENEIRESVAIINLALNEI